MNAIDEVTEAKLDGIADWPIGDKLRSMREDAVLARIESLAPNVGRWTTRLTVSAYRKGLAQGENVAIDSPEWIDCPYDGKDLPNFMRNDNDPRTAWRQGSLDGQRIRMMLTDPRKCSPPLRQSEYRLLPASLKAIADAK